MSDRFVRTKMLIGEKTFEKLKNSKIAIFGLGGVGSYAAEIIARCGVENIVIFDGDRVDATNINRQILADSETIGRPKTEVMKDRILKINENAKVEANFTFFDSSNANNYDFSSYNYIIDAIDTITSKILLICKAKSEGVPIISSMGVGNKINPLEIEVAELYATQNCPLARVMRRELKKRGIENLKVVYSKETPKYIPSSNDKNGKRINSSISFVPSVAGIVLASEVVKNIIGCEK
ncbi:MAG: ThiF family adenylyltransferase [Acutalibacteraceae bacterium]